MKSSNASTIKTWPLTGFDKNRRPAWKKVGEVLTELLDMVINDVIENEKGVLLETAIKIGLNDE